jgi:hypothetical protein
VPCSRVFRSSAPSEHLPSSRGRRLGRRATVDAAALDQWNGGSAPVRRATSTELPGRADLEGMLSGPVRFRGRVARHVIQNWPHVPQQQPRRAEPPAEGTGEYARLALPGAPISLGAGHHAPDQVREMAAELAGWTSGKFPGSSPRGRRARRRPRISRLPAHSFATSIVVRLAA